MAKDGEVSYSTISCKSCQRRKVKCDRCLPRCEICVKSNQSCVYATARLKPGPKIGASQRIVKRASLERHSSGAVISDGVGTSTRSLKRSDHRNMAGESPPDNPKNKGALPIPEEDVFLQRRCTLSASHNQIHKFAPDSITAQNLSLLIHPSHEVTALSTENDNRQLPSTVVLANSDEKQCLIVDACRVLHVTMDHAKMLICIFHENMNSFSLFHEPSFEDKLSGITSITHLCALLSAIFSYSLRFDMAQTFSQGPRNGQQTPPNLSVELLSEQAVDFAEKSLKECSDASPPLCLLQATIINTFQMLIKGVRGNAWRSLGTCIRLAYELRLHVIDASGVDFTSQASMIQWSVNEERRRAWWAIWELDTFASTVKRCPSGIDWAHNQTFLPIKDEFWFTKKYQRSCYLARRPNDRWKMLQESGNESPTAWYIVINSLMRDSQSLLSQGPEVSVPLTLNIPVSTAKNEGTSASKTEISEHLTIMTHAIHCFKLTLPQSLQYHGEYLSFSSLDPNSMVAARRLHSMIYIIFVMEQLAKFMIYHQQAFASMCLRSDQEGNLSNMSVESKSAAEKGKPARSTTSLDNNALNSYLEAADNILTIVKRSAENHIQHLNPLLASTIWLAAAVQLVCKVFGPPEANRELADSKYDVLRLHHRLYVEFWKTPQALQDNLESLEERLESLRAIQNNAISRSHAIGDVTASNRQKTLAQQRSEMASTISQQQARRLYISGTTTCQASTDDAMTLNTISTKTVPETANENGQTRVPQSQLTIGTWNQQIEDNLDNSSSGMPIGSDVFEELDYDLEWDFGFNDNVSLYLDNLLSGAFV